MAEQRPEISLTNGLFCTFDTTKEHPARWLTILGGEKPLALDKTQALALFKLLLGHLEQIAGAEARTDPLLEEVNLVQAFYRSIGWLAGRSEHELAHPDLLFEAHERYQHAYELQEEMLDAVNGWQSTLEEEYSRLEDAAEEVGVALDDLEDDEE